MAKALRLSTTALIVTALTKEVEAFEAKEREAIDREKREQEERRQRRRSSVTAPPDPVSEQWQIASDVRERFIPTIPATNNEFDQLYQHHARRIAEVINGDIREVRLRRDEALADFQRRSPLLCPPDQEILATLEQLVKKLAPSLPTNEIPPPTDDEIISIKKERP